MAMCRAHGVPAVFVKQPAHASYMYYYYGQWIQQNSLGIWGVSKINKAEYPWNPNPAYFNVMSAAQKDMQSFRASEELRIASRYHDEEKRFTILKDACDTCTHNVGIWQDIATDLTLIGNSSDVVKNLMVKNL